MTNPSSDGRFLYSTNPLMKHMIQDRFYGGVHYVWCSGSWDSKARDPYSYAAQVGTTSNPRDIYHLTKEAVESEDTHFGLITEWRAGIVKRATEHGEAGIISANDSAEIIQLAGGTRFKLWRPVLYVISRDAVAEQLQVVHASQRAGAGPEYIIPKLERAHFDVLEF